jgi:hypothetical protein
MRVDDGEIGKRGKMDRGRVQRNEFIQARSGRESRCMNPPRFGKRQRCEESGIVAVIQRSGEKDQADDDIG